MTPAPREGGTSVRVTVAVDGNGVGLKPVERVGHGPVHVAWRDVVEDAPGKDLDPLERFRGLFPAPRVDLIVGGRLKGSEAPSLRIKGTVEVPEAREVIRPEARPLHGKVHGRGTLAPESYRRPETVRKGLVK